MRRPRLVVLGLCCLAASVVSASSQEPRLVVDGEGRLAISGLPLVLGDADVQRHLGSGLTTSFVLRGRTSGSRVPGVARIDVRFELWDEVYLVTILDGEGRLERVESVSEEELHGWWSKARIVLAEPVEPGFPRASETKLTLDVIPFSQAELVDTQRWLAESMGRGGAGGRRGDPGGVTRAVGALIATSIQRRAVRSWSWTIEVKEDGKQ